MDGVELLDTTKGPNKALYYTVALLVLIGTVIGAVVYVSTRPGNTDQANLIVAGIFTFVGPAVAALLALMAALDNVKQTEEIKHKVNGTLTNLANKNAELVQQVVSSQEATGIAQAATTAAQNRLTDRPGGA